MSPPKTEELFSTKIFHVINIHIPLDTFPTGKGFLPMKHKKFIMQQNFHLFNALSHRSHKHFPFHSVCYQHTVVKSSSQFLKINPKSCCYYRLEMQKSNSVLICGNVQQEKISLSDCAPTKFLLCISRSVTQCLGACLSYWINLAQDRDKWKDVVNVVMILWVQK